MRNYQSLLIKQQAQAVLSNGWIAGGCVITWFWYPSTLLLWISGQFTFITIFSWWVLRRVQQHGYSIKLSRLSGFMNVLHIGLSMITTTDQLAPVVAMVLLVNMVAISFYETPQQVKQWALVSACLVPICFALRHILHLPTLRLGIFEYVLLYSMPPVLIALAIQIVQELTHHLRSALATTELIVQQRTVDLAAAHEQLTIAHTELARYTEEIEGVALKASGEVMRRIAAEPQPPPLASPLTPREREVIRLVAQGFSNREIATRLVISEGTVKTHVLHIIDKLQARDRTQAAVQAQQRGLL